MTKFFTLIKTNLQTHLMHRARVVIWILTDLGQYAVMPFIWLAVYGSNQNIGGYTREGIVSYYIIAAFVEATTTTHRGYYIADDIRTGALTKHLVRPFHYLYIHLFGELAYKIMSLVVSSTLLFLIYLLVPNFFPVFPSPLFFISFVISLVGAFLFSFFLEAIGGILGFWFGEVKVFFRIRWFLEKIFGGGLAPLTFLPIFLRQFAFWTPFQYSIFFPVQIFLGKLGFVDIFYHLLFLSGWLLFLFFLTVVLWKKGAKRYDGGGI